MKILQLALMISIFIAISSTAMAGGSSASLIVKSSRYSVLDDPNSGTAYDNFTNPPNIWGSDYWNGKQTAIRGYALIVNKSGGMEGITVTFNLKDPQGTTVTTNTAITNSAGAATASFNLNNHNKYGFWTIEAQVTIGGNTLTASDRFAHNWWGCANCHGKENPDTWGTATANSPYTISWEKMTGGKMQHSDHTDPNIDNIFSTSKCTHCHQSYDGKEGGARNGTNHAIQNEQYFEWYPAGVHNNRTTCDNSTCHGGYTKHNSGNMEIGSCNSCHNIKNTHISEKSILSGGVSTYSDDLALNGSPSKYHDPTPDVACVLCHGPMHNVSKPVVSGTSNNYTEDAQCTSCHVNQGKHSTSNPVYCTACHSQDAHSIGVLDKTAVFQPVYTTLGSASAMTKNDCTECHQSGPEADFLGNLTSLAGYGYTKDYAPATPAHYNHNDSVSCTVCHDNTDFHSIKFLTKTGNFSTNTTDVIDCTDCHYSNNTIVRNVVKTRYGSYPPTIPHLNHSTDNGGQKWGNYWTTDTGGCIYCHGDTKHNTSALGNIHTALGSDPKGGIIDNGTVCASCHVPDDPEYDATTALLSLLPPPNQGAGLPSGGFNHSSYGANDSICIICHGGLNPANMSEFPHMVDEAMGGKCTDCHFSWDTMNLLNAPSKYVNETLFNQSVHVTLSCKNCHTNTTRHPPPKSGWKVCEDCHSVEDDPINQSNRHNITRNPYNYTINGVSVVNITDCRLCHDTTLYNNSIATYSGTAKDCDYCHSFPDDTVD